jgi:hypothetical protein
MVGCWWGRCPAVIHSEAEYRRQLGIVRRLMERPEEELTVEEGRLLELLGMLVEEYEDRVDSLPKAANSRKKPWAHLMGDVKGRRGEAVRVETPRFRSEREERAWWDGPGKRITDLLMEYGRRAGEKTGLQRKGYRR